MPNEKAIVNAEDAVRSITAGMSDEALMEKYDLSQRGLQSLFKKLAAAGAIDQSVLDRRRGSLHGQSWICSLRKSPRPASGEPEEVEFTPPSSKDRSVWVGYKHYVTAACGALAGGLIVFFIMTFLGGSDPINPSRSAGMATPTDTARSADLQPTEELISILEAIANDRSEAGGLKALGKVSDYDDCLKNCTKNFPVVEQSDKAFLINCRRECMAQYAERVKGVRKRFYSDSTED